MRDPEAPYAEKRFAEIEGRRMAYIDEGEGAPIVFAHGNPTSSYLWRNVMPAVEGLGRVIACDMIGMGDSDKLEDSGPDRYNYAEQRRHLFALWEHLGIDADVILVLHDWGCALGLDWANQHRDAVQGIAYMEGVLAPVTWDDWPEVVRPVFQGFRSPAGEKMVLEDNLFVEGVLPGAILRTLTDAEMAEYRRPFAEPGEGRRPTLSWPRQIPIEGEPADVVKIVEDFGAWLATADVPKLFVNAQPGAIINGRIEELCRTWPNQTEVAVAGSHFVQEDSAEPIGAALAEFVRGLRG